MFFHQTARRVKEVVYLSEVSCLHGLLSAALWQTYHWLSLLVLFLPAALLKRVFPGDVAFAKPLFRAEIVQS